MKIKILILCLLLISCSRYPDKLADSLELAEDNRQQLEEVIEHYKGKGEKDKLHAAYYLISNMKDKGTYINELVNSNGNPVGFNISNFKNEKEQNAWLDSIQAVHGDLHVKEEFLPDLEHITSDFLINNIDKAFEVKYNSPFCQNISDSIFYENILPYRVSYEKLENWRDSVLTEFSGLKDSIYGFSTVLAATNFIDNIYQKKFKYGGSRYFKQKEVRCYSELLHDKAGKCDDMCNLVVMGLRTLGIPSGFDGIQYKRANDEVGHGWCFVYDIKTGKNYPFDALSNNGPGLFNLRYKNSPKVFRKQFSSINDNSIKNNHSIIHPVFFEDNSLDVTSEYFETVSISITLDSLYAEPVYLNIWHRGEWKPVDYSYKPSSLVANFSQVSKENIYCLSSFNRPENKVISEPFIINRYGEIKYGSSLGVHKKTDMKNYNNRQLNNAKNNAMIFEFGKNKNYKKVCIKIVQEDLKKNEWSLLSNSLETNRFYFLSDSLCSNGRIFVFGEDKKSINWY
ncbi:hypothetical protein [Mangrovibacterium sp.]|uniref:hypothetical protein n=1 Tax=Mangrovibacterium sp. TaxID=1961364 RepID=UPI0035692D79